MTNHKILMTGFAVVTMIAATAASADQGDLNLIYLGAGASQSADPLKSSDRPISIGYLRVSNESKLDWGIDVGREGTLLDSTWSQSNQVKQATSYNFLIGGNLFRDQDYRIDATILIGARESFSSCPSSYLGYQCYADTAPSTDYKGNYGALLTLKYRSVFVGLRATGESTQALLGFGF